MGTQVKPHLLIGCVGDRFLPGVKEAIGEAVGIHHDLTIDVVKQANICVRPYFGLATMRNRLTMKAYEEKYTHVCLLDNDVLIPARMFFRYLMALKTDITFPAITPAFSEKVLLYGTDWQVFSCIMFRAEAFAKITPWPFLDTMTYCEEETLCHRWALQGASIGWSNQAMVTLLEKPHALWEVDMNKVQGPGDVNPAKLQYVRRDARL